MLALGPKRRHMLVVPLGSPLPGLYLKHSIVHPIAPGIFEQSEKYRSSSCSFWIPVNRYIGKQ